MTLYTKAKFLYPPRPIKKVIPGLLGFYENRGYWAQVKKNGTCSILGVGPSGEIYTQNRHGKDHSMWKPSEESLQPFKSIMNGKWHVFVVEVMDAKTPHIKDSIYVHDIVVHNGRVLEGSTFSERQILLRKIFPRRDVGGFGYEKVTDKVWLATLIKGGFRDIFNSIEDPKVDEGLVLKDPNGKLEPMWREGTNSGWQVKCRKPHKNYSF